ncbi:biotin/lipoyl-binding protein [Serratia quinivorans]
MKAKRVTLITAAIGVAFTVAGCKDPVSSASPAPPPSVPVAEVVVRPVTPFVEFTGSLTAVKQVELRPRVAGYLQDVSVPEGHWVEKGQRLFLIDPREFEAALSAAKARLVADLDLPTVGSFKLFDIRNIKGVVQWLPSLSNKAPTPLWPPLV